MRLDHVSYVATHDQISDVVQRIGSQIGTAFIDGGIHPRFGTRNFTAPLKNDQYVEIVCALDHPAAEQTSFGQAVSKKAAEGGGWLTWVFAVESIEPYEQGIGRTSISGHRHRPDGSELNWKQIGVKELLTEPELPFFIQWEGGNHPSKEGKPVATIQEIEFANSNPLTKSSFSDEVSTALSSSSISIKVTEEEFDSGITSVVFVVNGIAVRVN